MPIAAAPQTGETPGRCANPARFDVFTATFAAASILLLVLLHARNLLDSDEGVILNGAWNLLNDRRLYTDFFEFLAPGSFYLVLAAWKVFGSSFWVAKCIGITSLVVAAFGVHRIGELVLGVRTRRMDRNLLAASTVLFCIYSGYSPAINHNTFHLPLAVWSTYFAVRALQQGNWRMYAVGGLLAGTCMWLLQHRAVVMAAATLVAFLALGRGTARSASLWGSTAYLLAFLIPVAALLFCWSPSVLLENLIVFPATRYAEVNVMKPTLFLFSASLVVGAAWLLRRAGATVSLLLALQAALLLSVLHRADLSHVTSALFPLLALIPLLLRPMSPVMAQALQLWIAAGMLALTVPLFTFLSINPEVFFANWSRHPALEFVRERCGTSPYLYAGPFAPGLYYETRRLNPTRYSILLTRLHTDEQFVDARADLQAQQPPCVITHYAMAAKFRYTTENPVDVWISANYDPVFELRGRQVWMAKHGDASARTPER